MSDRKPSLARQVAPAAILTAAGVAFVSLLDNPTGTNFVSLDGVGDAAVASTTAPVPTPTTIAPAPAVATTLAPSPLTTVVPSTVVPSSDAPVVESTGACDGAVVTSPTALFRWGGIQLQVNFTAANAICDVQVLQYPSDDRKSVSINQRALPVYNQEAVAANSAQISAMSGATDSWEAYTAALQAVIDSRQ
ncbi:MAG: hypothetical protein RL743_837 [Actinomycetota bacterium]|jgi:uncharacterized protein with FMN-binding domain